MGCGEKQLCSINMQSNAFNGVKMLHFLCHFFSRYLLYKYPQLFRNVKIVQGG
jgi:hypothetical protein